MYLDQKSFIENVQKKELVEAFGKDALADFKSRFTFKEKFKHKLLIQ